MLDKEHEELICDFVKRSNAYNPSTPKTALIILNDNPLKENSPLYEAYLQYKLDQENNEKPKQ